MMLAASFFWDDWEKKQKGLIRTSNWSMKDLIPGGLLVRWIGEEEVDIMIIIIIIIDSFWLLDRVGGVEVMFRWMD